MKFIKLKRLRVDKRTKVLWGLYRYKNVTYLRLRGWGVYWG